MELSVSPHQPAIAYFSMEIALDLNIPTYAGGLGVLAGDILRSAADLGVPMVGVTLLHRKGYFRQHLDEAGVQTETHETWSPEDTLDPLELTVTIEIDERAVKVRAWRYLVTGIDGDTVPVYLLDTAVEGNSAFDQTLTDQLYGGDQYYRLCQEAVLGLGGLAVLRALGHNSNATFHMNEGHSALLTLGLLSERLGSGKPLDLGDADLEAVRQQCVFTTHTPVPAGHDQFPKELVKKVLGPARTSLLQTTGCLLNGTLNMTYLGLRLSRYINGVSMKHGEVSLGMFPGYPIYAITNGVHALTWTAPTFRELFDKYFKGWRHDNRYLRYAIQVPLNEIQACHRLAKRELLAEVARRSGVQLSEDAFTLVFARRAAPYKRADLLLRDVGRLRDAAKRVGPIQAIYAGKAHPRDGGGKAIIRRVVEEGSQLSHPLRVVYLENYDVGLARHLVAGADLWLNTPRRPREASGTSGMKAACNGVPSLSILDGWWIEGHIEGVTGWSIPHGHKAPDDESAEVDALYDKLERVILPLFYAQPLAYAEVMRWAIAINASFFNTQRVVSQYLRNAYGAPESQDFNNHK